jgi:hypothetical protein
VFRLEGREFEHLKKYDIDKIHARVGLVVVTRMTGRQVERMTGRHVEKM